MAELLKAPDGLAGIVLGRVDFALSAGMDREDINSRKITDDALAVAELCRTTGLTRADDIIVPC